MEVLEECNVDFKIVAKHNITIDEADYRTNLDKIVLHLFRIFR